MNFILKKLIKMLTANHALQLKLFFYIAEIIVKRTDNDLDDKFIDILRESLGHVDIDDLKQ